MFTFFAQYGIRPAGFLLAVVFLTSLVWCGDAGCWSGTGDGDCASLICALLIGHDHQDMNHADAAASDCHCVCHMPTVPGEWYHTGNDIRAHVASFVFSPFSPHSPSRSIYHPPRG